MLSVITSGDRFRAIITALMSDSRIKLLAHPSILAVDGKPARIQVGSEQPVATGTLTSEVGTPASSTTSRLIECVLYTKGHIVAEKDLRYKYVH